MSVSVDRTINQNFFQLPNDVGRKLGSDSEGRSALYLLTMLVSDYYTYQESMTFRQYVLEVLGLPTHSYNVGIKRLKESGFLDQWQSNGEWHQHWVTDPLSPEDEPTEEPEVEEVYEHFKEEVSSWVGYKKPKPRSLRRPDRLVLRKALQVFSVEDLKDCTSGIIQENQEFRKKSLILEHITRPHNIKKYIQLYRSTRPTPQVTESTEVHMGQSEVSREQGFLGLEDLLAYSR